MDNLDEYTLGAWVSLRSLPTGGHGFTIVGKGPEAAAQHFWWWIGYEHGLVLEVGGPQHRWGASFGTGRLPWALNHWYHVAVTFRSDGKTSTAAFYRDGRQIATSTKQEAFHSGSYDLFLGSYEGSSRCVSTTGHLARRKSNRSPKMRFKVVQNSHCPIHPGEVRCL